MRRWLFNIGSAALLLCLLVAVLWVRSYSTRDAVERFVIQEYSDIDRDIDDVVYSNAGLVMWVHHQYPETDAQPTREKVKWEWFHPMPPEQDPERQHNDLNETQIESDRSILGVSTNLNFTRQLTRQLRYENAFIILPHRILVILLSILPAIFIIIRLVRRNRRSDDRCGGCGYNLTGNTSGVCPECGTAISGVATSAA